MGVRRLLDNVRDEVEVILNGRIAPGDDVAWDLSLATMPRVCGNDIEGILHIHPEMVYTLYVSLDCPESESELAVSASVPVRPKVDVAELVDQAWTQLALHRIGVAEGLDGYDDDSDDCEFEDEDEFEDDDEF